MTELSYSFKIPPSKTEYYNIIENINILLEYNSIEDKELNIQIKFILDHINDYEFATKDIIGINLQRLLNALLNNYLEVARDIIQNLYILTNIN